MTEIWKLGKDWAEQISVGLEKALGQNETPRCFTHMKTCLRKLLQRRPESAPVTCLHLLL